MEGLSGSASGASAFAGGAVGVATADGASICQSAGSQFTLNAWIGRSYADAPDVDGVVYVTGEGLAAGAIVPCEIVARSEYDLVAAAIGEPR